MRSPGERPSGDSNVSIAFERGWRPAIRVVAISDVSDSSREFWIATVGPEIDKRALYRETVTGARLARATRFAGLLGSLPVSAAGARVDGRHFPRVVASTPARGRVTAYVASAVRRGPVDATDRRLAIWASLRVHKHRPSHQAWPVELARAAVTYLCPDSRLVLRGSFKAGCGPPTNRRRHRVGIARRPGFWMRGRASRGRHLLVCGLLKPASACLCLLGETGSGLGSGLGWAGTYTG